MKLFTNFVILTAVALVVGCAFQAPAPSGAAAANQATATQATATQPTPPPTPPAAAQKVKFVIPDGYDEVVIHGRKVYCQTEAPTGTRIQHRSCRTEAQLEAQQEAAQRLIQTNGGRSSAMGAASLGPYGEGTQLAGPSYYQPAPR
jgi:hypothetical protein